MMLALIRLSRPYYSLPLSCGLIVITSYIVGGNFTIIGSKLAYAFLSLFFVLSAGYVLNDVCDIRVDTINSPNRMLPRGCVTRKTASVFSSILFILGIALASGCGWRFFSVLMLIASGLVIYDLYSKKMGLFKDILVAILTTSLYPLSFALAQTVSTSRLNALYIFPIWLFLTTTGYEMLKDIRDIKGDSILRDKQYRSYCTNPGFLLSARIIILTASLLTVLPYVLGYCKQIYFASSLAAVVLAILSLNHPPAKAIRFIYAEVFLITAGSMADLWVYGP